MMFVRIKPDNSRINDNAQDKKIGGISIFLLGVSLLGEEKIAVAAVVRDDGFYTISFVGVLFWILAVIGLANLWLHRAGSIKSRVCTTVILALAALTPLFWIENNPLIFIGFLFAACLVWAFLYSFFMNLFFVLWNNRIPRNPNISEYKIFRRKTKKWASFLSSVSIVAFIWEFVSF